jgi:hypothetical protein
LISASLRKSAANDFSVKVKGDSLRIAFGKFFKAANLKAARL